MAIASDSGVGMTRWQRVIALIHLFLLCGFIYVYIWLLNWIGLRVFSGTPNTTIGGEPVTSLWIALVVFGSCVIVLGLLWALGSNSFKALNAVNIQTIFVFLIMSFILMFGFYLNSRLEYKFGYADTPSSGVQAEKTEPILVPPRSIERLVQSQIDSIKIDNGSIVKIPGNVIVNVGQNEFGETFIIFAAKTQTDGTLPPNTLSIAGGTLLHKDLPIDLSLGDTIKLPPGVNLKIRRAGSDRIEILTTGKRAQARSSDHNVLVIESGGVIERGRSQTTPLSPGDVLYLPHNTELRLKMRETNRERLITVNNLGAQSRHYEQPFPGLIFNIFNPAKTKTITPSSTLTLLLTFMACMLVFEVITTFEGERIDRNKPAGTTPFASINPILILKFWQDKFDKHSSNVFSQPGQPYILLGIIGTFWGLIGTLLNIPFDRIIPSILGSTGLSTGNVNDIILETKNMAAYAALSLVSSAIGITLAFAAHFYPEGGSLSGEAQDAGKPAAEA